MSKSAKKIAKHDSPNAAATGQVVHYNGTERTLQERDNLPTKEALLDPFPMHSSNT